LLALLTPYGRNEVTAAALRLAEFGRGLGRQVKVVACGGREPTVHPGWDGRVLAGDGSDAICRAVTGATAVVHFQCHKGWHEKATLVTKAKQILVPNWHGLSRESAALAAKFDQVVCPTRACRRLLAAAAFAGENVGRDRLTCVRWDAGLPVVRRTANVVPGRVTAAAYCDASAVDRCGPFVQRFLTDVVRTYPRLDLTVLSAKSWPRRDRLWFRDWAGRWGGRVRLAKAPPVAGLAREFVGYDWVMFPGPRSDFGFAAALATAAGAGVVCYRAQPFTETVPPGRGVFAACEAEGRARIVPDLANWQAAAAKAFADDAALAKIRDANWRPDAVVARDGFEATWRAALDW